MHAATCRFYLVLGIQTELLLLGQQVLHSTSISPGPRLPILQDPDSMLPCPPRGHSAMLSTPELPGHFPLCALILSHVTTSMIFRMYNPQIHQLITKMSLESHPTPHLRNSKNHEFMHTHETPGFCFPLQFPFYLMCS